jgi:hypothetical protein
MRFLVGRGDEGGGERRGCLISLLACANKQESRHLSLRASRLIR